MRRTLLRVVLGMLVVGAAFVGARPASATTTELCDGYSACAVSPYSTHDYPANEWVSYWGMTPGDQCTNYVAWVETTVFGVPVPDYWLSASYQWSSVAAAHGVVVNSTPTVGAVAQWGQNDYGMAPYGHVAVVEYVAPDQSYIEVSQQNVSGDTDGFDWERIDAGTASNSWEPWPDDFIHFAAGPQTSFAPIITSAASLAVGTGTTFGFSIQVDASPQAAVTATGSLPSGVGLTTGPNGAHIAGTPAPGSAGTYPIAVTAANGVSPNATQTFTLTVTGTTSAPTITSASSSTFAVGSAGSFTVTTTGTPTPAITETGALPSGVTFTDDGNGTATLAGTPAAGTVGSYPVTLSATNGTAPDATQLFTVIVDQAPRITSASATTFDVGAAGSFTVTTTGTPTPALSETGRLPGGVTFTDGGNGTATVAGTPAGGSGGSYPITITATNGVGTNATQSFTLTVDQAPVFTSATSVSASYGKMLKFTVSAVGPPTPGAITETGTLPTGVSFSSSGGGVGTLSGKPTRRGTFTITFTATNAMGTTQQTVTLTVH